MAVQLARRQFSMKEYHRLIEAGILGEDDRVELLDGEIIKMAPIGPRHAACVDKLAEFLGKSIGEQAIVRVQSPIGLSEYSEPQPDISLLKRRADFYADRHPLPGDVLIAIEVADTTVDIDREVKIPSYAAAGIPEAWLVDLPNRHLEIHTHPAGGTYQDVNHVVPEQKVASSAIPQLKFKVEDILG